MRPQLFLISIVAFFVLYPVHAERNSGVIAHWTFDEGGGDSAFDKSGNGNHFKLLNGVQWIDSKNGTALVFDGIDDKGLCADQPIQTGMSALSIEAVIWVEHHAATKWGPVIGKWGPGSSEDDSWALDVDRYGPYGGHGVVVGNTTKHINGTTPIPIQRWIHLVYTWNGTKMKLYLNGRRIDSVSADNVGPIQDSPTEIRLGHNVDPHFFNGMIDQITIYNYALHPDTIVSHFEELVGPSYEINIGMKTHYTQSGSEIWVPVYITNFEDSLLLNSIEFSLNIDTTVLSFSEVSSDSGMANNWSLVHNALGDSIKFSMGGVGQTIGYGEGELIRCKFLVKPGLQSGTFSDLILSDVLVDEGNNVYPTTTIGKVIVDDITVLYGDVSGNGEVTAYDAAGIVQYVLGILELPDQNYPNFTMKIADVSGDGVITSYDAALVFQYSVGLLQKFPVETERLVRSRDGFQKAAFKLIKSPLSTANTVYYDLKVKNVKGAVSSDIQFKYDPNKVLVELGGTITTTEPVNIESTLDTLSDILKVSITTPDDIDIESEFILATIEVPVLDTNSLTGGLLFIKALINEEPVNDLDPSITVISNKSKNCQKSLQQIVTNNTELMIFNSAMEPVQILMYDLRGRKLLHKQYNNAMNDIIRIDMRDVAPNLYLFKVKIGSRIITRSFIKTR